MRSRIKTTIRLAPTYSCSRMRVGTSTKTQAPLTLCSTLLWLLLCLAWPMRRTTFVSWRHQVPEERSGYTYSPTHGYVTKETVLAHCKAMYVSGSWSGARGKTAYDRSCGNQRWLLQSASRREWLQKWSNELSHPRGALPHQGDLRSLASVWWEGLWERHFHSLSC